MARFNFSLLALRRAVSDPRRWLGTGLLLLMVSLFMATSQTIYAWEEAIIRWVYGWPPLLTPVFVGITFLGSVWAVVAIILFYVWRKRKLVVLELGLAAGTAYGLSVVLKFLVARQRPFEQLAGISSREVFLGHSLGYPSAHAAVSTVLALLVLPFLPKGWRWLAVAWIILVGLSRLHLGVHAPLDVIGGIGLGLTCAGFIKLITPIGQPATKR